MPCNWLLGKGRPGGRWLLLVFERIWSRRERLYGWGYPTVGCGIGKEWIVLGVIE